MTKGDRDDTHQNIGSNDIRIITDRLHKEYLAMERRHDKHGRNARLLAAHAHPLHPASTLQAFFIKWPPGPLHLKTDLPRAPSPQTHRLNKGQGKNLNAPLMD